MKAEHIALVFLILACGPEKASQLPVNPPKHAATSVAPDTSGPIYHDAVPLECEGFIPHTVGGSVSAPIVIRRVEPQYPEVAFKSRVSAETHLEVFIRRNGTVCAVRIVRPAAPEFDAPVANAVKQWQFAPAMENGIPVDCIYQITVKIRLA